jgi:hypothetical protein
VTLSCSIGLSVDCPWRLEMERTPLGLQVEDQVNAPVIGMLKGSWAVARNT